jgi:hypothetical protein
VTSITDALALLDELEWSDHAQGDQWCPSCGSQERYSNHSDDCRLVAVRERLRAAVARGEH